MSSLRIVNVPVKVPVKPEDGPRLELVCDWVKELDHDARPGYRVRLISISRDDESAEVLEQRDHPRLSSALKDCARRVQALEQKGYR